MPVYVLVPLLVIAAFVPGMIAIFTAFRVDVERTRLVLVNIWLLALGFAIGLYTYGYGLHPDWWGKDGMVAALLVLGLLNLVAGVFIVGACIKGERAKA